MWVPHVRHYLDNFLDKVVIIIKYLNFEIQYLLNRNSDSKTLYMKIDQKNITNTNTLPICLPPPLTYRASTFPLRCRLSINSPVPVKTYRMNLSRTRKLFGIDQ